MLISKFWGGGMQIGGKICLNGKAKFCQKTFKMPNYYIFFDLAAPESIFMRDFF